MRGTTSTLWTAPLILVSACRSLIRRRLYSCAVRWAFCGCVPQRFSAGFEHHPACLLHLESFWENDIIFFVTFFCGQMIPICCCSLSLQLSISRFCTTRRTTACDMTPRRVIGTETGCLWSYTCKPLGRPAITVLPFLHFRPVDLGFISLFISPFSSFRYVSFTAL